MGEEVTADQAREVLLSLPGTAEGSHHGHPDFRVKGKIFATLWPDQGRSVLRLPLPMAEALEAQEPSKMKVVSRPGDWGWLSVQLNEIEEEGFRPLAEEAWSGLRSK